MTEARGGGIGLSRPGEVWEALSADPSALLVDVRTRAEWTFVGLPDLSPLGRETLCVEWLTFPAMAPNPAFADTVARRVEETGARAVYFLCRSGARSQAAAETMQARFDAEERSVRCVNVIEGFEGDLDPDSRRGRLNGWKAQGLPWRQS
jgi:rhodanese-related sulfurtransferase